MVKAENIIQHKLETLTEWEAHTEQNAPKDWLYGAPARARACARALATLSAHAHRAIRATRAIQSWRSMRRGAGQPRRFSLHSSACTRNTSAAGSSSCWCVRADAAWHAINARAVKLIGSCPTLCTGERGDLRLAGEVQAVLATHLHALQGAPRLRTRPRAGLRGGLSRLHPSARAADAQNGELLETIDGVNTPLLKKHIADHLTDGIIDDDEADAAAEGEDEED